MFMPLDRLDMHFLENSMFVLRAYFCRELRFVTILRSKLRFLFRNTGVDSRFYSEFLRKKLAVEVSVACINRHVQPRHGYPPPSRPPWCWRVRNAEDQQQIEKSTKRWDHHAFQVRFVHLCPNLYLAVYIATCVKHNIHKQFPSQSSIPDIAAGTTQGNLASHTRITYLPVLMEFLKVLPWLLIRSFKYLITCLQNPDSS